MSIIEINSSNYGSTGNIMLQIAEEARHHGYKTITCCPKSRSNEKRKINDQILIGNRVTRNFHLMLSRMTGYNGVFSVFSTLVFLKKISKEQPKIIHLHNLHNCYINLPLLFRYIKKYKIPVVWTLHDCWAFTGQCPYFTLAKCDKWKEGCHNCPSYRGYPESLVDKTKTMWGLKKKWFTGVANLTIVTPSKWLGNLVKQSYLKEYPVKVINNGIDLNIFKPTKSDFREKHGILADQYMLLGVAFGWEKRKGLDVFIELSKRLDKDQFRIVLVGTDDYVDKKLPNNIISIHRTQNQTELAEIYSAADLFVNPTREENYPTVNMEAIACGTPVITFQTGGSPEIVDDETGRVVDYDNVDEMEKQIIRIANDDVMLTERCISKARMFDQTKKYLEYISLYESL